VTLLAIGAVSGVLGIALAAAQQDLKRLLAYSSIENVGIIAIGVGLATLGHSLGRQDLVLLGLGGALLHALNHSLFKSLLFLCAGSVLHETGTRHLPALGGLAKAMPRTASLFALGALAICGLPPLNGFVSELLLYIGLLRAADVEGALGWVSSAAAALAVIGVLAGASFIKVLGLAFGGTPRSAVVERAHDPDPGMLAPMGALALACVLLGLAPGLVAPILHGAVSAWQSASGAALPSLLELAPLLQISALGLTLGLVATLVALLVRVRASAVPRVVTWDCGYARPTPRMQYSSSSFAETLVGLFAWAVLARRSPEAPAGPFPGPTRFRSEVPDAVLDRLVLPALVPLDQALMRVRALQRGGIHRYLLYVFVIVVLLLGVA
jgi:hydrogenase-4 component B